MRRTPRRRAADRANTPDALAHGNHLLSLIGREGKMCVRVREQYLTPEGSAPDGGDPFHIPALKGMARHTAGF